MQPWLLCTCAEVNLPPHILELIDSYGVDGANGDFPHNTVSQRAVQRACGRLHCASHAALQPAPPGEHAPGEAALCAALSAAASNALATFYVGRGDEGDHRWAPFSLPVVAAPAVAGAAAAAADGGALVTGAELLTAACGALWPSLGFSSQPAAGVAAELDAREGEEATNEGAAWRAAAAALEGGGARAATYLRPVEAGGAGPAVWPHFLLARTPAGSLAGVIGATVWT
jgi:hypothetical protein